MTEKKLKILLVDNNPLIIKLLQDLLAKEGHEVRTAQDGLTAIGSLKESVPDLVITDLIMPNISGEKLCGMIRTTPEFANVFIIILSGIAAEEELNPADYGANLCIAKGQFKKVGRHVLDVVRDLVAAPDQPPKSRRVGYDEVYQREITKELLCAKKHFEVILANMSEGIIEFTPPGEIIYVNLPVLRMLGLTEEKLLAGRFADFFESGVGREKVLEVLEQGIAVPLKLGNHELLQLNGRRVAVNFLPVKDEEQETVIAIISDITDRKQVEEERERLIHELQEAFTKVKTLSGFLPICASCKKIRDDKGYWNQVEEYIRLHSDLEFSHGICPDCAKKLYPGFEFDEDR
jgi:PAS domain S-box-containing protein